MENKGALPRLLGAEFRRSLTVRFLLVSAGVVLCICLDTWNQIPFMWTSPETMDVYYSQSRRFWHVTILYCTTAFFFCRRAAVVTLRYRSQSLLVPFPVCVRQIPLDYISQCQSAFHSRRHQGGQSHGLYKCQRFRLRSPRRALNP